MARHRPNAPPARNGVSPSCVVLPAGPWPTLVDFLQQRFPSVTAADWHTRLDAGEVVDAEGHTARAHDVPRPGRRLYYYRSVPTEPRIPFEATVLWQDEHLLVADKPHFLPVIPSGKYVQETVLVRLKAQLGLEALSPIHRIDRDTAGLVLFSVNPATRNAYQALFRDRVVHKVYEAIAAHDATAAWPVVRRSRIVEAHDAFFRMCEAEGEPNSETRIDLQEARGDWARYRLEPLTGKRHQLRVHLNALGLPIAGDQFYPRVLRGPQEAEDFSNPLRLLASTIAFTDPVTGEARAFQSQRALDWPA